MKRQGWRDEYKWAVVREAKRLGVNADALLLAVVHLREVNDRQQNRRHCECCGRKVLDHNLENEEVRPYVTTEDDCYLCEECAGAMGPESATPKPEDR